MKNKDCDSCGNCVYIGEGDFACIAKETAVIVKEDFAPNEYFLNCEGELWEEA